MPGELLAQQFLLTAAPDRVPADFDADGTQPIAIVPNPDLNPNVQSFTVSDPFNSFADPDLASFNTAANGRVPSRTSGVTYTDGNTADHYVTAGGSTLAYGTPLNPRNKIAGDFDGDGDRDINDIDDMVRAWQSRNGGPAWNGSADASFEILGDHNNDGNFTEADVRYAADGLVLVNDTLDRAAGFTAVDDAFGGNFFGTTISGGGTYTSGDSRFDVAGSDCVAPGFVPLGADGIIDQADRDYIAAQFIGNPFVTDGEANWDDTTEAVGFDLSCDVTGDLIVNQDDLDAIDAVLGVCYADCDGSGTLDFFDFLCFQNAFALGEPYADCDGTGVLDFFDFLCFQNEFGMGCP